MSFSLLFVFAAFVFAEEIKRSYTNKEITFITLSAIAGLVAGVLAFLLIYYSIKCMIRAYRKKREAAFPAEFQKQQNE